jgi:hypothetical protein
MQHIRALKEMHTQHGAIGGNYKPRNKVLQELGSYKLSIIRYMNLTNIFSSDSPTHELYLEIVVW